MFIGYSMNYKAFCLWSYTKDRVIVSRDLFFDETSLIAHKNIQPQTIRVNDIFTTEELELWVENIANIPRNGIYNRSPHDDKTNSGSLHVDYNNTWSSQACSTGCGSTLQHQSITITQDTYSLPSQIITTLHKMVQVQALLLQTTFARCKYRDDNFAT